LLCTFADGRVATRLTMRMLWLGTCTRVGPRGFRRNAFLKMVMPAEALAREDRVALAERLAAYFGHDLGEHPPVVDAQLGALKRYDATPRLKELAGLPTLIVSAAHDPIARPREGGQVLARGMPWASYVEYADASHGVPLQFPERINELLGQHIFARGPSAVGNLERK